jgi:hypothetical protein
MTSKAWQQYCRTRKCLFLLVGTSDAKRTIGRPKHVDKSGMPISEIRVCGFFFLLVFRCSCLEIQISSYFFFFVLHLEIRVARLVSSLNCPLPYSSRALAILRLVLNVIKTRWSRYFPLPNNSDLRHREGMLFKD